MPHSASIALQTPCHAPHGPSQDAGQCCEPSVAKVLRPGGLPPVGGNAGNLALTQRPQSVPLPFGAHAEVSRELLLYVLSAKDFPAGSLRPAGPCPGSWPCLVLLAACPFGPCMLHQTLCRMLWTMPQHGAGGDDTGSHEPDAQLTAGPTTPAALTGSPSGHTAPAADCYPGWQRRLQLPVRRGYLRARRALSCPLPSAGQLGKRPTAVPLTPKRASTSTHARAR